MVYRGPVHCCICKRETRPAQPGHKHLPPSHGICADCWPGYRAANGLKPAPYPSTEGASA